jgi:hypothetical protein
MAITGCAVLFILAISDLSLCYSAVMMGLDAGVSVVGLRYVMVLPTRKGIRQAS